MAKKRRPPPKNQLSPPPPTSESSEDEEQVPEEERDVMDEFGEEDSESELEEPVPNHPDRRAATTREQSNEISVPESGKGGGATAKKSFQRIWSDEDQMTLVQGMVDYIATRGKDPIANIEGFWLFIRKLLSFTVTEGQLMRKIRAVKDKYRNNQKKGRAFSKAYDAELFELSKKVWGAGEKSAAMENNDGGKKRKGGESYKEAEADDIETCANGGMVDDGLEWVNETVNLSMEHTGWSEELARAKIKSMADSEGKSFAQLWKQLKSEELSSLINRRSLEGGTMKAIF